MPIVEPQITDPNGIHASAITFYRLFGARVTHTVAVALSALMPELTANSEPEKFLTMEECVQWAHALLAQVPADWQGIEGPEMFPTEAPPPPTPEEAQRIAAIKARLADAARPEPIYRENTKGLGGL